MSITLVYWNASLLEQRGGEEEASEIALLREENARLLQEMQELKNKWQKIDEPKKEATELTVKLKRKVIVPSMCRCSSGTLPVPHASNSFQIHDTNITQEPSLATGKKAKHFFIRNLTCECLKGQGEVSADLFLQNIERQYCGLSGDQPEDSKMDWNSMPDFAIEPKLPLFLGVLSYKSPKSLDATLTNWETHGLVDLGFSGAFLQLNARSKFDDAVIAKHNTSALDFQISGTPDENLHPGLAIARFCRAAEQSRHSHPNGENLLLFLEKDWQLQNVSSNHLQAVLQSANTLVQRGVPYVRLSSTLSARSTHTKPKVGTWQCDANGMTWDCATAHQHRYTNLPSVIRCDWFLRYLEPFALVKDPVMHGCRNGFQQKKYFDWEEAMQDGRIAWSNSQWVVASYKHGILFHHHEVDK
jgi:hypothetical protein